MPVPKGHIVSEETRQKISLKLRKPFHKYKKFYYCRPCGQYHLQELCPIKNKSIVCPNCGKRVRTQALSKYKTKVIS